MGNKATDSANRSIHILQMGKHFLYLPIYYAAHNNFFGFLPAGVEVVIDEPVAQHTDSETYRQMMDDSQAFNSLVIAITDPTQIFNTPLNSSRLPAVLATLVTNGAFWAINHGTYGEIESLKDLVVFDRIIAYGKGTTSYNIAARIARDSNTSRSPDKIIRVVNPGEELLLLSDAEAGANAVALSPDILHIEHLTSPDRSDGFRIELAIGDTAEYNDVIVTALVANNEFVKDNRDAVIGILKGIQQSLKLIHNDNADVLRFARSYFRYADKAEGALRKAISAGVIPRTIAIAQSHWKCAAKTNSEQTDNDTYNETKISQYYHACIEPYEQLANECIKSVDVPIIAGRQLESSLFQRKIVPLIYVVSAIAITAKYGWMKASLLLAGFLAPPILLFIFKHIWKIGWATFVKRIKFPFLVFMGIVGIVSIILPFVPRFGLRNDSVAFFLFGAGCIFQSLLEIVKHVERQSKQ